MKRAPLISVIIPVYNVEHYLRRCINSVINQDYDNVEIILIDDGSTDNSSVICDSYANSHGNIRVIHKENEGQGKARNEGLRNIKGEYVTFIDSDDIYHPQMLSVLYNMIEINDADIATCDRIRFYDDNFKFNHRIEDVATEKVFCGRDAAMHLASKTTLLKPAAWDKMYRVNLFEDIKFPTGLFEDMLPAHRLLLKASRVAISKEKLYGYFIHPNSIITSAWTENKLQSYYEVSKSLETFYTKRGDDELRYAVYVSLLNFGVEVWNRVNRPDSEINDKQKQELRAYYHKICSFNNLIHLPVTMKRKLKYKLFDMIPTLISRLLGLRFE